MDSKSASHEMREGIAISEDNRKRAEIATIVSIFQTAQELVSQRGPCAAAQRLTIDWSNLGNKNSSPVQG